MSKFAPWTKLDAENEVFNRTVYGKRLSPHQQEIWLDALAWAAAQIEKCETLKFTIRNGKVHTGSYEVFEAKLVGVREVSHE